MIRRLDFQAPEFQSFIKIFIILFYSNMHYITECVLCALSCSVVSDSLWPHGLPCDSKSLPGSSVLGNSPGTPGRASGARDLPCPHCRPPHGGPGEGFGRRGPALSTLPAAARRPQGGLPRDGRDPAEPRRGEGGRRRADPRMGGQGDRHAGTRACRTPPGTRIRDGDAGARERPGREDLGRHAMLSFVDFHLVRL